MRPGLTEQEIDKTHLLRVRAVAPSVFIVSFTLLTHAFLFQTVNANVDPYMTICHIRKSVARQKERPL